MKNFMTSLIYVVCHAKRGEVEKRKLAVSILFSICVNYFYCI